MTAFAKFLCLAACEAWAESPYDGVADVYARAYEAPKPTFFEFEGHEASPETPAYAAEFAEYTYAEAA